MNDLTIGEEPLTDYGTSSERGDCQVYFKNLDKALLEHIRQAPVVMGCVAWLNHTEILRALAGCAAVSIVVQKEELLRPDLQDDPSYAEKLRELYRQIPGRLWRYDDTIGRVHMLSFRRDPAIDGIRCVGQLVAGGNTSRPLMHHKFVVFGRYETEQSVDYRSEPADAVETITPYGVWTGSFNFTHNATRSFENAIYLTDPRLVQAYFMEWSQVVALSEELDWSQKWVNPQWRVGSGT